MKKVFLFMTGFFIFSGVYINASAASIDDLIKRNMDKKNSYKDMTVTSTLTPYNREGNPLKQSAVSKIYYKGDKYRAEMVIADKNDMDRTAQATVFDGTDLWAVSGSTAQRIPKALMMRYKWESYGSSATVTGTEFIDGRFCHIVQPSTVENLKFWVDDKSLETVKIENSSEKMAIISSDFRPTGRRFEMPYKTESTLNGKTASVAKIESVEFDSGLSDKLFTVGALNKRDIPQNVFTKEKK